MTGALLPPLLVYDGDCAFCSRSVQFILKHDRRRTLQFAARNGIAGSAVRVRHPALAAVDSMVWVDRDANGREVPRVRADSVLAVADYLGGGWRLLGRLGRLVPRFLRDRGYAIIAHFRRRLGAGGQACVVFTPEERARSLD